jgi:hypothetical protein
MVIAGVISLSIYLKPEPPIAPASIIDVKVEPCVALGIAAREADRLATDTLAKNLSDGLSNSEMVALGNSAQLIQSELLSTTTGQANNFPSLEAAILQLANSLGIYSKTLKGLSSELEISSKAVNPIRKLAKDGERACISAGFGNQFKDASGWEK